MSPTIPDVFDGCFFRGSWWLQQEQEPDLEFAESQSQVIVSATFWRYLANTQNLSKMYMYNWNRYKGIGGGGISPNLYLPILIANKE